MEKTNNTPLADLQHQLDEETKQRLDRIKQITDQCNQTIREMNAEIVVLNCAITGFSKAVDEFIAERNSHG